MRKNRADLIFLIVYLAYTSIYIARVNLSQAGPELISSGVLDSAKLGLLGSVFSTLYSVGRFINGGLSDKTPPWTMINTSMLSIYPMNFLKSGNVASVRGIMDFSTYLGAGISASIYGIVIKSFGYLPMSVSWIVISAISALIILKINKKAKN